MGTLCYSIRLKSLVRISAKAFKARGFDSSVAIIPAKFVFGRDYEVQKSEAWWIAAWILERKELQYSTKKSARFTDEGYRLPDVTIEHHKPQRMTPVEDNTINELRR